MPRPRQARLTPGEIVERVPVRLVRQRQLRVADDLVRRPEPRTPPRADPIVPACRSTATSRTAAARCPPRPGRPARPRRRPRTARARSPGRSAQVTISIPAGGSTGGRVDRVEVEHEPRVAPDLAEAAPVGPSAAGFVVFGDRGLDGEASALGAPAQELRRRARPRCRDRAQWEASRPRRSRSEVVSAIRRARSRAGVLAVRDGDEPRHVLGLAPPVDEAPRRSSGRLAHGVVRGDDALQLVDLDGDDLDHRRRVYSRRSLATPGGKTAAVLVST